MIRVPAAAERNTKSAAEKIYKEMNAAGNSRRDDGVWRSLVARSAGGREVAGSNPVTPTESDRKSWYVASGFLFEKQR